MYMNELTNEQEIIRRAILDDLDSRPIITVGGYAGTDCLVCAPTGKAAHVLKSKGVSNVQTLHSALYRLVDMTTKSLVQQRYDGAMIEQSIIESMSWAWKGTGSSVLLIDEGSMIPAYMFQDIIEAGLQCVVFGDHGQLPPVKQTASGLMESPDYCLETLHRNAGPIAHFCEHLRKGGSPTDWKQSESVRFAKGNLDLYCSVDQVICARNKTRQEINRAMRSQRGFPAGVPVVEGERLISLMNNKHQGLWNGSQVVVEDIIKGNKLLVRNDGAQLKVKYIPDLIGLEKQGEYDKRKGHPFDWAYAITAHKAQGSEWDSVAVVDEALQGCGRSRWRYTAASRAKNLLYWIGI